MVIFAAIIFAAALPDGAIGRVVKARGAGTITCATAFLPDNKLATENWVAGFWAAWDMSQITQADPLAANSDLNGIVGEVEKVCRDKPSLGLLIATLEARSIVKAREQARR